MEKGADDTMNFKHEWNNQQQKVLSAFKEYFHSGREYVIALNSMLHLQKEMQNAYKKHNLEADFFDFWHFFGNSEDPAGKGHSCKDSLKRHIFLQSAAAVLTDWDMKGPDQYENMFTIIGNICFNSGERYFQFPEITLRDKRILEFAQAEDWGRVKFIVDTSRNSWTKLKNVYHDLLRRKCYDRVMIVNDLCGGLEKIDHSILEHCFYTPVSGEGKVRFNRFYMEHFSCFLTEDFWLKHRRSGNLQHILIPALEWGIPAKNRVLPSVMGSDFSLHQFLCFIDEVAEELMDPGCRKIYEKFYSDVKCAQLYTEYLKNKQSAR